MARLMEKYGLKWPSDSDPLQIEFSMIRRGKNLYEHFKNAISMIWPDHDWHRWAKQALEAIVENEVTIFMGCSDSGKTNMFAKWAMVDWWVDPEHTLTLVSSTERRGADLRIWGNIKELFNAGRRQFPWLEGKALESRGAITMQSLEDADEGEARSLRSSIIMVPCMEGGQYVGLGKFVGVKSPRLRHIGDETQAMKASFLDAYDNWYGKSNFKGMMAGNPFDKDDPLGKAAEPVEGWDSFVDSGKTQTWRSKFFNAFVLNFDGRDSPNFDYEIQDPPKFPYLIGRKKLEAVAATHGKDGYHYHSQCVGKLTPGMAINRILTRDICRNHKALEVCFWSGDSTLIEVLALDPAYGGGDRCTLVHITFGKAVDGRQILKLRSPEIIPIRLGTGIEPEDQIAAYVKGRCDQLKIDPSHCFYDSFGRGTLGFAFGKVFGSNTPVPVDSGSQPTKRPVRFDLFVIDDQKRTKRLKRCDEHYSKFVTEMWYSLREAIESEQVRELPAPVMDEGCQRIFTIVGGNRIEAETKEDLKERMGKSPDLMDVTVIGLEGCRRLGFKIERLGSELVEDRWQNDMAEKSRKWHELNTAKLLRAA